MHEGHRQRMYEKLKFDSAICEHELLEILLYNALPRINTNHIAHALIDSFGSLYGVLEADIDRLMTVHGVGKNVALYLKCIREVVCNVRENKNIGFLITYQDFKRFTTVRMRGRTEEVLELYCLEKNGKIKRISSFTDSERSKVEVRTDNIASVIATEKPYGILVAHNHLSGNSAPSANDDRFTAELQILCSINNVNLYDHCIYASDTNIYSYFASGKIDELRKDFSFKQVVDNQFKSRKEEKENKK